MIVPTSVQERSGVALAAPSNGGVMTRKSTCAGLLAGVALVSAAMSGPPAQAAQISTTSQRSADAIQLARGPRPSASLGTMVARVDVDGDRTTDRVYLRPGALTDEQERPWTITVLTARGRSAASRFVAEAGDIASVRDVWRGAATFDGTPGAELMISVPTVGDFPTYSVLSWRGGKLVKQSIPRDRDWLTPAGPGLTENLVSKRAGQFVKTRYQIDNSRWFGTQRTYRWNKTGWKLTSNRRIGPVSEAAAKRAVGWHVKGFARS